MSWAYKLNDRDWRIAERILVLLENGAPEFEWEISPVAGRIGFAAVRRYPESERLFVHDVGIQATPRGEEATIAAAEDVFAVVNEAWRLSIKAAQRRSSPRFAAAFRGKLNSVRMQRQNADPVFVARRAAGIRRRHGGDPNALTPEAREEYDTCRSEGFRHREAIDIARDAEQQDKVMG